MKGQIHNYMLNDDFIKACHDYFYLIDRHYPEKGILKLVGDRYHLTGDQRTVLYRGISSSSRANARKKLLTVDISSRTILVDGYNVLFTLINYRFGKIIFISNDNILRDAGSLHGKLRDYSLLYSCIDMLIMYLSEKRPAKAEIYLDSPVSHSQMHAAIIRERMKENNIEGECIVLKSADWALRHGSDCILATSDTGIIEKALLPVADVPRSILQDLYKADFLKIEELFSSQ